MKVHFSAFFSLFGCISRYIYIGAYEWGGEKLSLFGAVVGHKWFMADDNLNLALSTEQIWDNVKTRRRMMDY